MALDRLLTIISLRNAMNNLDSVSSQELIKLVHLLTSETELVFKMPAPRLSLNMTCHEVELAA